jgi:hypothetical protein
MDGNIPAWVRLFLEYARLETPATAMTSAVGRGISDAGLDKSLRAQAAGVATAASQAAGIRGVA